jgi:hypothetical protein
MPQNVTHVKKENGNVPPVKHLLFFYHHNNYAVSMGIVTLHIIVV